MMGCYLPSFLCPRAYQNVGAEYLSNFSDVTSVQPYFFKFFISLETTYPNSMEEEWEAFIRQGFPLAERVYNGPGGFKTEFTLIEELGRQREQSLMRTVVVDQLSHL